MENHSFEWENQLSMAIFNSYVRLPEGIMMYNMLSIYADFPANHDGYFRRVPQ